MACQLHVVISKVSDGAHHFGMAAIIGWRYPNSIVVYIAYVCQLSRDCEIYRSSGVAPDSSSHSHDSWSGQKGEEVQVPSHILESHFHGPG